MVRAHVVVLGHVLGAEAAVGRRVVELERFDHAALHRRKDFRPRQLRDARAHRLEHVGGQTDGAVLQALERFRPGDLLLEPAERLGRHGEREEADHVEAEDLLVEFVVERLAAAVIDPAEALAAVEAIGRAGAEQRRGAMLAVPVGRNAVAPSSTPEWTPSITENGFTTAPALR